MTGEVVAFWMEENLCSLRAYVAHTFFFHSG